MKEELTPAKEQSFSEIRREKRWHDYEVLKTQCEVDPDLKSLFGSMERSLLSYVETAARHEHQTTRSEFDERITSDDLEALGKSRTLSHNVLIDSLNILSRAFAARGLDNTWRKVVGLDHRSQVTAWAIDIAQYLTSDARVKRLAELQEKGML